MLKKLLVALVASAFALGSYAQAPKAEPKADTKTEAKKDGQKKPAKSTKKSSKSTKAKSTDASKDAKKDTQSFLGVLGVILASFAKTLLILIFPITASRSTSARCPPTRPSFR